MKKRIIIAIVCILALIGVIYPVVAWYIGRGERNNTPQPHRKEDSSSPATQRKPRSTEKSQSTPHTNTNQFAYEEAASQDSAPTTKPGAAQPWHNNNMPRNTSTTTTKPTHPNTQQTPPINIHPSTPLTPPTQPPVTPPTQPTDPPVNPQPPTNPPIDPKPPVNPPTQPTDEEKARQLLNSLKSSHNSNVAQFTNDQGQIRTVLWVNGITAPRLGAGGDFVRQELRPHGPGGDTYVNYLAPYTAGQGWYDINKSFSSDQDANLCFAAVAGNMLHWWYDRNAPHIDRLIQQRGPLPPGQAGTFKDIALYKNSFTSQQKSAFWDLYKLHFGYNQHGFYSDLLVDLFINGHTPKPGGGTNGNWEYMTNFSVDPRGGLFHSVFDKKILTYRTYGGTSRGLQLQVTDLLQKGNVAGLAYTVLGRTTGHIVTLWGAEYDLNGKLVGVYVSDSDDIEKERELAGNQVAGMRRYSIADRDGRAILSNNTTRPTQGSSIDYLHVLTTGQDDWEHYFTRHP